METKSPTKESSITQQIQSCGYTVDKKLGSGTQGSVFGVYSSQLEGLKAFKNVYDLLGVGVPNLAEIDILCRLRHPNLLYAEDLVIPDAKCHIPSIGLILPLASYTLSDLYPNKLYTLTPEVR